LAVLTFTGNIQMWELYIFSLVSGAVGGLFTPASGSIIPVLMHGDEIQAANSVSEGTGQLTMFIGPALAGGMIAAFGDSYSNGIAFAFVIDTVTFLASVLTLRLIRIPGSLQKRAEPGGHILGSIQAGLVYAWRDPLLRSIFTTIIVFNILLGGTWAVGIPVLADSRLPEGAAAFGLLMAANAGGNLLGTVLAGNLRQFRRFTLIANFSVALFGLGFIALGLVNVTWIAFLILFVMGVGMGYVSISIITLLQRRTPKPYLGRIMSLMYFSNIGLNPFSRALAGAVVGVSLFALFGGAGVLLILLGVGLALQRGNQLLDKQIEQFGG
jgi:MFS family permease